MDVSSVASPSWGQCGGWAAQGKVFERAASTYQAAKLVVVRVYHVPQTALLPHGAGRVVVAGALSGMVRRLRLL